VSTLDGTTPDVGKARRRPRAAEVAPYAILGAMIVALALVPVVTQHTVRTANVYDIFQNFASYGLVALSLGIAIIAGEFDLSVSSVYLFGGMVAVLTGNGSPLLGILAALGAAILVGLVQGGLIAKFRLNSMPVTLGGYLVVLGITYILGHSQTVVYNNYAVSLRLDKPVLQIFSIRSLVSLGIFVAAALVLRYMRIGRDIRAIGGDRRAARVAGVSVDRLMVGVFVIAALGAALPGALLSYSLATASPTNIGFDVLTFSATAALIGGVSLSGGKGSPVGIAAGVLSLSVLEEILAILGSPDYVSSLITGGLLIVVTIVWAPELSQWFRVTRVAAAVEERA
jgi:ribose/xylose/arabinose/galactoside ABC-type transport system permease subunit